MILYKNVNQKKYKERPSRTINIKIEEKPERPTYDFKNNKDRYKYCTMIKNMVRRSPEYREYVSFLKKHMDMNKCIIFRGIQDPESNIKQKPSGKSLSS